MSLNFFYSIFKKQTSFKMGGGTYSFVMTFIPFVFFSIYTIIGITLLLLKLHNEYTAMLGLSLGVVYPLMHIFIPGYNYLNQIDSYSNLKVNIIYYLCVFSSIGLIYLYFRLIPILDN